MILGICAFIIIIFIITSILIVKVISPMGNEPISNQDVVIQIFYQLGYISHSIEAVYGSYDNVHFRQTKFLEMHV